MHDGWINGGYFVIEPAFFVYQLNYSIVSRYNKELQVVDLDNKNVNELLLVNKVEDQIMI